MNVLVINGSPKGKNSITYQTVKFLQKKYPEDSFETVNAGQKIKILKKDFSEIKEKIRLCDFILFSYPVYTFLAPAQLHEFFDLLKQNFSKVDFIGKFASQITTSKHFYDTTAQEFIKQNCSDLGLTCFDGLFADMDDLTKKRGQKEALDFWRFIKFQVENANALEQVKENNEKKDAKLQKNKSQYKVKIVCDFTNDDINLKNRITLFQEKFAYSTEVFNLSEFKFNGGCLGCLKCAQSGVCIHSDGFSDILRNQSNSADAVIYAFTIKNHSMGTLFKYYDDRQFCNGHRTMTMDKPVGYIINGNYENEYNLQTVIKARASVGHNILTKVATEKTGDLDELVAKMEYCLENPIVQPQNFYGIGGMKIFRDLIYVMAGFMKKDYEFYKKEGFFKDLPTNQKKTRFFMFLVGKLMSNKKIVKKAGNKINEGMLMPYTKVLNEQ